jgi:hypothetical protein
MAMKWNNHAKVYPFALHLLLGPLAGLADDDEEACKYAILDANDECQVKPIIERLISPHFLVLEPKRREAVKTALKYYLSKPDAQFDRVFDSLLPPFSAPDNARNFFVWIWEVLFDGEDYQLDNLLNEFDVDKSPEITYQPDFGQ